MRNARLLEGSKTRGSNAYISRQFRKRASCAGMINANLTGGEGSAGRQGASHAAATFSLGLGGGAQMFTIEFSVRLGFFFFLVGMHEMFPPKNVLFT